MKYETPVDRVCSKCGLIVSGSLGSGRNHVLFCFCKPSTPWRAATQRVPMENSVAETSSLSVVEQIALLSKSVIFKFLKVIKKRNLG